MGRYDADFGTILINVAPRRVFAAGTRSMAPGSESARCAMCCRSQLVDNRICAGTGNNDSAMVIGFSSQIRQKLGLAHIHQPRYFPLFIHMLG